MTDLDGKVVLVTGGARGIGAGIVQRLLAANARVIIHFNQSGEAACKLAAGPHADRCHLIQADLGAPEAPLGLWEQALAWQGKVDVLINNAAVRVTCGFEESFEAVDKAWNESLRVNAIAPAHLCRLATRHWKSRETSDGIIINLSSRVRDRLDHRYQRSVLYPLASFHPERNGN